MALVLCTGVQKPLMHLRREILEAAGHIVHPAMSALEVEQECRDHKFNVAVIGQGIPKSEKRRILQLVRQACPTAKILELYTTGTGPALNHADDSLLMPLEPTSELVEHVSALAAK